MYFSENIKPNKTEILLVTFLYSILPISYIAGSLIINLNFLIIDLAFIYAIIKNKDFPFKELRKEIYLFLLIFFYILINSITQYYYYNGRIFINDEGLIRSIGLIKYFLFYFASIYFFTVLKIQNNRILNFWTIILFIVIIDVFFERINGHNLLNIKSPSTERISSFFGDELIVGYFILSFGFISVANICEKINFKNSLNNNLIMGFLILLIPLSILITGERSNFIKSLFICIFVLLVVSKFKYKINLKMLSAFFLIVITIVFFNSPNLKTRYLTTFEEINKSLDDKNKNIFANSKHFYNYQLGYDIFKENILFGVSTKKFRWACKERKDLSEKMTSFGCSTHPHQTYIEILAEHGLIGFLLIFGSLFIFIKNRFKEFLKEQSLIKFSSVIFLISLLIPFLPFGSFFSTSAFSMIMVNLIVARSIAK